MSVLLLTEHYYPKIGGTVSYVEKISVVLSKQLPKVYLLVPAVGEIGSIEEVKHPTSSLILLKLGVTKSSELKFNAEERDLYCQFLIENIVRLTESYNISVVHLLFGLFVANILDTKALKLKGIKTVHTVHNIPPEECSISWKGDSVLAYWKDKLRKYGVRLVNKNRITKNQFDLYVVPSESVKDKLKKLLSEADIKVIAHGGASAIEKINKVENVEKRILTIGGMIPHKNQHLIPVIGDFLQKNGVNFRWDVVGPVRNQRYYDYLKKQIDNSKSKLKIQLHHNIPKEELDHLYKSADLYIQLSSEEGFCMTVLDAISNRLPVIATPVGAIPEMVELVDGVLVNLEDKRLNEVILHYINILDSLDIEEKNYSDFVQKYTWNNAVHELVNCYNG